MNTVPFLHWMRTALASIACGVLAQPVVAQTAGTGPQPFVFGDVHTIHSTVLHQDRVLNVHLPEGYSDSTVAYPVVYVLDGSANEDFPHIAGLMQFMNMYDLYPKCIVVGIANEGRSRYHDFTSPTTGDSDLVWVPTGGGSADFINYIANEVEPFVEKHYRTSGRRTIIGQSLGGLLATEILFTRPELFDDYILVSPSLWWNRGALAASADGWVKAHAALPKRVYIAVAPDDEMMQEEVDQFVKALNTHSRPPLFWSYKVFIEESHATILHRAVYDALELFGSRK
jgi:predicted alpha/beta superfamily hydrolase